MLFLCHLPVFPQCPSQFSVGRLLLFFRILSQSLLSSMPWNQSASHSWLVQEEYWRGLCSCCPTHWSDIIGFPPFPCVLLLPIFPPSLFFLPFSFFWPISSRRRMSSSFCAFSQFPFPRLCLLFLFSLLLCALFFLCLFPLVLSSELSAVAPLFPFWCVLLRRRCGVFVHHRLPDSLIVLLVPPPACSGSLGWRFPLYPIAPTPPTPPTHTHTPQYLYCVFASPAFSDAWSMSCYIRSRRRSISPAPFLHLVRP